MNEVMQLIEVDLKQLLPHPDQHKVYESRDNSDLRASVEQYGLKFPIEVVDSSVLSADPTDVGFYVIYSGHRRLEVLKELGYQTTFVNVRKVNDTLEVNELFILANRYRNEKSESEKINEILYDKQIMCQVAEVARIYHLTKNDTIEKLRQGRILLRYNITPGEDFSVRDYIQNKYAVSEHKYKQLTRIFDDDYLDGRLGKLNDIRGKIDAKFDESIREIYTQIRDEVVAFEKTYRKADIELLDMLKSAEKRLKPKSKKTKANAEKRKNGDPTKIKMKMIKVSLPKSSLMPDSRNRIANAHNLPCSLSVDEEFGFLHLDAGRGAIMLENSVLHDFYNQAVASGVSQ